MSKISPEKMPAAIALQNAFVDTISQMSVEDVLTLVLTIGENGEGDPPVEKFFESIGKKLEDKGFNFNA